VSEVEKAKAKVLQMLLRSSSFMVVDLNSLAGPWKCDFDDLKAAVQLLQDDRCIQLRKWDEEAGRRYVPFDPRRERWFFYFSHFEARLLPRGRLLAQEEEPGKTATNGATVTVKPFHFEDFDGHEFERLAFAYLLRTERWRSLEWYGEVGSDMGRDIWGVVEDARRGVTVCVQCANRKDLAFEKVSEDVEKLLKAPRGKPDKFLLVTSASPSAKFRDRLQELLKRSGIYQSEVWGAVEFEERVRANCQPLLERFFKGKPFPDEPAALADVLSGIGSLGDAETLAQMSRLFDRPAFYTSFSQETSIPAFEQAITDTIEALGTGVYRLRDGTVIRRMSSRHDIRDASIRETLARIERLLCELREEFKSLSRSHDIRPCGCTEKTCWMFHVSHRAAQRMDDLRNRILEEFRGVYPHFRIHVGR
jgi:hypothetical protein